PPVEPPVDPPVDPPVEPGGGQGEEAGAISDGTGGPSGKDGTDTYSVGSWPIEQTRATEELAATGSGDTGLVLVGAAVMVAGGVGFRLLPRLVSGRGSGA
ncbi:LPXTG-motif cell wall-anchored protein, partial [Streptomyces sp. KhCrAH-43]